MIFKGILEFSWVVGRFCHEWSENFKELSRLSLSCFLLSGFSGNRDAGRHTHISSDGFMKETSRRLKIPP